MFDRRAIVAAGLAMLIVAACPPAFAQQAAGTRLALKGHDPVAYFTQGRPTLGQPQFETEFDEVRYRFASEQHLQQFRANPDRFVPQFSGSCAASMAKGMKVEADPTHWLIVDNKLYVFAGPGGPDAMRRSEAEMVGKARENWKTLAGAPFR